jgi:hypothetical protein
VAVCKKQVDTARIEPASPEDIPIVATKVSSYQCNH